MSPLQFLPIALAVTVLSVSGLQAQAQAPAPVPNTEFKITKITPDFRESPGGDPKKRVTRAGKWLEIEISFDWQPRLRDPRYLDDLTVNYYILLNNQNANLDRQPTLLTGSVTHADVAQGRDLHSVIYVNPRTLERLFAGSVPGNAAATIFDLGVTLSSQGQIVAESSLKGQAGWWNNQAYKPVAGLLLNKNESAFSGLAWDYYEPIKPKAAGAQ